MADTNTQQKPRAPDDSDTNTARQGKARRGKTRDAFAFRDFDKGKILQRKFFANLFSNAEACIISAVLTSDAEFLSAIITEYDIEYFYDLRRNELERLAQYKGYLYQYLDLFPRHIIRLERYSKTLADKIASSDENLEARRNQYRRVQFLLEEYKNDCRAVMKLRDKAKIVLEDFGKSSREFFRKKFGKRLTQTRRDRGVTRAEMATELNLSVAAYQHYENGTREPNLITLALIAKTLSTSTDYLLGIELFQL